MTKPVCSLLLISAALALSVPASADVISTVPEFTGTFIDPGDSTIIYPQPPVQIGTFTYTIPIGATIYSATLSGTYGSPDIPGSNTTALSDYFVSGGAIQVAGCDSESSPCFNEDISLPPVAWTYRFTSAQLAVLYGGSLDFTEVQNGPFTVQTGPTTLDISTVPEPSPLIALCGGLAGLAFIARRRRA